MLFTLLTLLAALGIFLGMLAMLVLGRRLGARHLVSGAGRPSLGAVEGAVFGLLGLSAHNFLGQLICAVLGALLFLWLLRFIKK